MGSIYGVFRDVAVFEVEVVSENCDPVWDGYKNKEYKIISAPTSENLLFLYFKENLVTGTYKLVFKLYDADTYIGEAYEYFVIK